MIHIGPSTRFDSLMRIYALHAFQKKSKTGIAAPKREIEPIKSRLKRAEEKYAKWLRTQEEQAA